VIPLLFLAALLLPGCTNTPDEEMTPEEWLREIRENTKILEQLRSYDKKEQQEGVQRFLKLGKERGSEVVAYILNNPGLDDYRIEVVLARLLAEWKDERAIPFLIMHLSVRESGMRETVKEGLQVFGSHPKILKAVEELVQDPDTDTRRFATEILSEMEGPRVLEILGRRFEEEKNLEIRGLCLMGIIANKEAGRTGYLINALGDSDPDIRGMAWAALARKKPPVEYNPRGDPADRLQAIKDLKEWARAAEKEEGKRRT